MLKNLYGEKRTARSQGELNTILASHHRYATYQGGARAQLAHAKLDGLNLANRNLVEADFSGASLVGANLSGSNLERASLYCADLRDCNLKSAKLGANLDGEDLRPVQNLLVGRPLLGLSARNTIAIGIDFSGSQLEAAKFDGADLRDANFTNADLRGASFRDAKLAHARFDKANLCSLPLTNGAAMLPEFAGSDVTSEQFLDVVLDQNLAALGIVLAGAGNPVT